MSRAGNLDSIARLIARELRSGNRLKVDCGKCRGSGWMANGAGGGKCDACGGKGWTAPPRARDRYRGADETALGGSVERSEIEPGGEATRPETSTGSVT
jgi:hypothetical protein